MPKDQSPELKNFALLKKVVSQYSIGMKVLADEPTIYYLAYAHSDYGVEEKLFASLVVMNNVVYLYVNALDVFPDIRNFMPEELLKKVDDPYPRLAFRSNVKPLLEKVDILLQLAQGII